MDGLVADLDVALLPIWGWGPTIGPRASRPRAGGRGAGAAAPEVAIPIHWGTLRPFYKSAKARYLREPPEAFAAAAARLAPEVTIRVLAPGEGLELV